MHWVRPFGMRRTSGVVTAVHRIVAHLTLRTAALLAVLTALLTALLTAALLTRLLRGRCCGRCCGERCEASCFMPGFCLACSLSWSALSLN
ncbi:hypothetical protein [Streptomyces sp. I6]|uniref:hypothetical protein n=1 Tax=Streptomyces sp. I6 TaxID=2483113 RepID=UPI00287FFF56|nr:hypothetical protein [Streptomyces sp. I6]